MIFRNMIHHWPVMAFVAIVVTLMCVADMNWPAHMGGASGGLMSLVGF